MSTCYNMECYRINKDLIILIIYILKIINQNLYMKINQNFSVVSGITTFNDI